MMQWTSSFSCSNEEIDEQHKKLIYIINRVSSIVVQEKYEISYAREVFKDLEDYVTLHFNYEQNLMRIHDYPATREHIIEHDKLRFKIKDTDLQVVSNHEEFFSGILIYLVDWVSNHIMETDKNLGIYIANKTHKV